MSLTGGPWSNRRLAGRDIKWPVHLEAYTPGGGREVGVGQHQGVQGGGGRPMAEGGVGLARRVDIGLEKLQRSTAVIFWTFLS